MSGCQCNACQFVKHDSDCAVHNEPAHPNEACNCSKLNTKQSSNELAENLQLLAKSTNNQFLAQVAYRLNHQQTRITELQAQLEAAKQVANDCKIVADNAIAGALQAKELINQMVEAVKQDHIEWEDFPPSSLLAFSKLITAATAEGKACEAAAQRLRHLDLVTKEYDELVRHMDAGGDFTAFMVSKSFKEST